MNTERFLLSEKENVVVIIIAGNLLIYTGYNVVVVNGGKFLCVHDQVRIGIRFKHLFCSKQIRQKQNRTESAAEQTSAMEWKW